MLQRFELVVQVADAPAAGDRLVQHRSARHLLDVLPEVADRQLLRDRHVAVVGRLLADDHPEQRRLAGAVRADEADLLARIELKGRVDEQDLPAVLLVDRLNEIMGGARAYCMGWMSLWQWLGLANPKTDDGENRLQEIEKALASFGSERARYLACFAYILTRPARADHDVTDAEAILMEHIVAERAGVTEDQAATIVRVAREAARHSGGTEDYLITREFERLASSDEKLQLLDALFAISAADDSILTVEDNEVRRVASELKLEHGDYIATRRKSWSTWRCSGGTRLIEAPQGSEDGRVHGSPFLSSVLSWLSCRPTVRR